MTIKMSVHVLQNPIKVIKIEGNLNDSKTWGKYFSKMNGDIFSGYWLIALKSFSYQTSFQQNIPSEILNVSCNVVKGYETDQGSSYERPCNPCISEILLNLKENGTHLKSFESPTFFLMNNMSDCLELKLKSDCKKSVPFQALFHYYCQSN